MHKKPIKVAVIGLGNMGRYHISTVSSIAEICLVAVCDASDETLKTARSQWGCRGYSSIETLLNSEEIDAVAIAVPTSLHYEVGMRCLDKGIAVFIEKPIASTLEQAEALVRKAEEKNTLLMIGHIERFNPAIQALSAYVKQGHLGNIITAISRRESPLPPQIRDANVLLDLAVHDLDIIMHFMGPPISTSIQSGSVQLKDRHDHAEIFMMYPSGAAYVQVNWLCQTKIRRLSLLGTKATAELDYLNQTVEILTTEDKISLPVLKEKPLTLEWQHFISCIQHRKKPDVDGIAGLSVLKLIL
jgi:UDP-N-acetylglucosamine 3-dehydrogenase